MKKQLLRFTLYAIIVYLTVGTLNPPIAAAHPLGGPETHFLGVIDGQRNKRYADQFPNRNYAQTFAANLNAGEPYTVRLIYFLPSGREPRPNIDADMDALIKVVQEDYARDMERHGFGRKTFTFEADTTGQAVVHHVTGQFTAAYYEHETSDKVMEEIREQFDLSRNIYLIVVDSGYLINGYPGVAAYRAAIINSIEKDLSLYDYLASHELRHTFRLNHDFSRDGRGFTPEISKCTAEFLDVHRYFNAPRQNPNLLPNTTIQMFPPSLVSPPNTIRLRFEVSDPDGLHQARLHTPEVTVDDTRNSRIGGFLACKRLTGTRSTVEFVTTALPPKTEYVSLQMIDVHGNISWGGYPIDMTSLLPPREVVSIPDTNLAAAVREASGLAQGDAITSHTMLELVTLDIGSLQITDLTGLKHAINLQWLYLRGKSISDISALGGLTNLKTLRVFDSSVSDISALGGLTNLKRLELFDNLVSDISALGGLTNLTELSLVDNSVSDISALGGLTNLTYLDLGNNLVSDISALGGLTNLKTLYLAGNSISDISALGGLTKLTGLRLEVNSVSDISALVGLTQLTGLNLRDNLLSYASINTHIPVMQAKGIWVGFDPRLPTTLVKISGDQHGSPATPLSHPFVVEVRDERGWLFEGVPVRFAVTAGGGTLNITQTTTNTDGKAESTLTLGPNLGINTVEVSAAGVEQPVTFTAVAGEGVTIPDANLRAVIRTTLGVAAGVRIGPSELATLTSLHALNATIGNLTGLEFATNLTTLYLGNNSVSDISALRGLTNLKTLDLGRASVSDISALGDLTNLTYLNLYDNSVSDISALGDLTNLTTLYLAYNLVSDISALRGLTNLTYLNLEGNSVLDTSALVDLTNLTYLNLTSNSVSDISALRGLTNLTYLSLYGNSVSDISALAGLTNLTELYLTGNSVSDISALRGLTNLKTLNLGSMSHLTNNSVSDISALVDLTNLTRLVLFDNLVSDISALGGLTNLTYLDLGNNLVSDISALGGLTNLTHLSVGNSVSDISALGGLTNLTYLHLGDNLVSDISALGGLTNLTYLSLTGNSVSDISALRGLTNLTYLSLGNNLVSDISLLVANTGLGSGDTVDVRWNPLSYASIRTHIPTLQSRGVTVQFDNQAYPALLKISGDNQNGASFAPLSRPFVVEAQDANGSALAGISVTFAVTAGGGTLSTQSTTTDANGRAQSTLTLGPNLGTNTVEVSAAGVASKITFYAISDTEPITADVNNDGVGNILDLILIASDLGNAGTNLAADVNRDGVVSILDLVLAAGMFEGTAAAPSVQPQVPETLTAVEVQGWLTDAISLEVKDVTIKRGVMVLEQLLISLTPKETDLLANYPNPFNPETWIPYRLAEDGFVTLTIYDGVGQVVRRIEVGHRIAAVYEGRSKAIHWDGKNNLSEGVASGMYFYTLRAGDYSATRKMVILK